MFRYLYTYTTRILMAPGSLCWASSASPWWRRQMETFSALLAVFAGNSPAPGEFPALRPVTRAFHVFFDLRLNKPLSKQSWGWWFETLSRSLWRHCNAVNNSHAKIMPSDSRIAVIQPFSPDSLMSAIFNINIIKILVSYHLHLWKINSINIKVIQRIYLTLQNNFPKRRS